MQGDAIDKTRYAAQMMAATAVLASTAPDDFRRRSIGRIAFVYCHEFLRYARRAKNEIRAMGVSQRDRTRRLEAALGRMAEHDFGPYEVIRHRIGAHRQPLSDDFATSYEHANDAWNAISDPALRILAEDARAIWNEIDAVYGWAPLVSFPPVSAELKLALETTGYERRESGIAIGVGSFDATRSDAVLVIVGGPGGEITRLLVDAIRNVRLLAQLFRAVNGHEPFVYLVLAAVHVEACTLYDLTFGQPASTNPKHRHASLLEHLVANDPESPALPGLLAAKDAIPHEAEDASRMVRNRIGAHIDDKAPLSQSLGLLSQFDSGLLNTLVEGLLGALDTAARVDIRLADLKMSDTIMGGVERVDTPEDAKPYD